MDLQEIEVIIDKDGQVKLMVRGVKGVACLELTRELEAILGGQIEAREMTPEATETVQEQSQEWQWQKNG